MDEVGKLIKKRFEVADINRTNMVHFTPSERYRIRNWIDECPAVVRCKDCRFNNNPEERASETYWMPCEEFVTDGNWFCGWGKPKEGETDG